MQQSTIVIAVIIVALVALVAWFSFRRKNHFGVAPAETVLLDSAQGLYAAAQAAAQTFEAWWVKTLTRGGMSKADLASDVVLAKAKAYSRTASNATHSTRTLAESASAAPALEAAFESLYESASSLPARSAAALRAVAGAEDALQSQLEMMLAIQVNASGVAKYNV